MPPEQWPWRDQGTLARARAVARFYRNVLFIESPDKCQRLDDRMIAWSQGWVVTGTMSAESMSPDQMINEDEAGAVLGRSPRTVARFRRENKLSGKRVGKVFFYRVGDLLAFKRVLSGQGKQSQCTVADDGSSAPMGEPS